MAGLLKRLIKRAEAEIRDGRLVVAKPGDLLDAARMLLELEGAAEKAPSEEVGRALIERFEAQLESGDEGP
ncbi:MAG TPA: hypothetical protein ENN88_03905 [Candidatus Coatesbacteria bacterium]|nr:hypothetical protein [Candidatus Coatesbacteria bacterium]